MPEEDAFAVLVHIMQDYGLRELYKPQMEVLKLIFYQLEHLIQDLLPNLHEHFQTIGVAVEMFASQWFLTLFASKFTLDLSYRIMDIFLCEGFGVLLRVALALLTSAREALIRCNFEQTMKYFANTLPRKYATIDDILYVRVRSSAPPGTA